MKTDDDAKHALMPDKLTQSFQRLASLITDAEEDGCFARNRYFGSSAHHKAHQGLAN
jgi:hypothetical protein